MGGWVVGRRPFHKDDRGSCSLPVFQSSTSLNRFQYFDHLRLEPKLNSGIRKVVGLDETYHIL